MTISSRTSRSDINMIRKRKGRYQVLQPVVGLTVEEYRRDFDAEEWYPQWLNIFGVDILRMCEIGNFNSAVVGYVDFSKPVNVEFVRED
jgi:hypothetical protein